ncbi:MAG: TIM barrel protein [Candidatus Omnitrophica bacterium]|nr:TIM barrel protein [Candidatus Omnitrophota bacterium]
MESLVVALSTGCFYKESFFDVLEEVKHAGFSSVEVCSFPRHLDFHDMDEIGRARRIMDSLGLDALSFHAPFAGEIDITSPDPQKRKNSSEEIFRAAEAAATLRARNLVIHPGPEKTEAPPAGEFLERMRNSASFIQELSDKCAEAGMDLLLENMLPNLLFGHVRDLMWILASVKAKNIGICLDTGHANLGGSLEHVTGKIKGHLRMLHVNDNRGERDEHLPPGEGTVNWEKLAQELKENRFSGGMVLELSGETGESRRQTLEKAEEARKFLRNLFRE